MKTITINHLTLDDQGAKIAVPITSPDLAAIKSDILPALKENSNNFDLIEWRIDFFKHLPNQTEIQEVVDLLKQVLPEKVVITTFRTKAEGGQQDISADDYQNLLVNLAQSDTDLIDVEINRDSAVISMGIAAAHQHQKKVIGSYHNFNEVPINDFLTKQFDSMSAAGCDILKMAVMPQAPEDVLRLMTFSFTENQKREHPLITMAMSALGTITRISSKLTGSVITFASLDADGGSAPGQLAANELNEILKIL